MLSKNCLFCKIINNELPSDKVYESDSSIAILDIHPEVEGHTLLIPKKHSDNWDKTDGETLATLAKESKEVIKILKDKYKINDFNIIVNNGEISGQVIHHLHIHILPRRNGKKRWTLVERESHWHKK